MRMGNACHMSQVAGTLNLDNVVIADTTQYQSGAGIMITSGGVVNAAKTTFRNNRNNQHQGGAVYVVSQVIWGLCVPCLCVVCVKYIDLVPPASLPG